MRSARPFAALLFLFAAAGLSGPAVAQPDKSAALEKAKSKFETDSGKAEESLVSSLDKALAKAKAGGNKQMVEKLTYEKDLFVSQRILPTAVPAAAYLKQRILAQDALELAYNGAIKDCLKNKNDAEADALEKELNGLIKSTRGYGIAFPDLENKTLVLIENKASGTVLEATKADPPSVAERVQLAPKVGKKKTAQCWTIEREDKGLVFRNAASGRVMAAVTSSKAGAGGTVLSTTKPDPAKDTPERNLFKPGEFRREITLASQAALFSDRCLAVTEKKLKGVTSYELGFVATESPVSQNQLWVITEAK